ncbi:MAG: dockerin type I repeat-containing protein, partial [candidate division Zixibacteria bacterium]|nr:dockerin type I repeat-containing protein [candidate division Zixibacteria bacterium]
QALPAEYNSAGSDVALLKCGFSLSRDIARYWNEFDPQQQSLVTSMIGRPVMDTSVVSPGAQFRLHYDTTGPETVPAEDLDVNGIPDFVDRAGVYLDSAWNLFHTKLGYLLPPDDGTSGGDSKYDVYFASIGGYGITFFDPTGPAPWDDFTSFILIHRDFAGFAPNQDPEGSQIGALKVTCAHEYFHAVQLAYDGLDDLWMYESSATWNEVELFPEVKDNYQFLPFFYNDTDTFLTTNGGFHPYGAFVWPLYLAENYTDTLMRKIWEASISANGIDAIDDALSGWGVSTGGIFADFGVWNFFTGDRAQAGYYPSGAEYPGVILDRALPVIPFTNEHPLKAPDGLASTYMSLATAGAPAGLALIELTGNATVVWDMSVILKDPGGAYETRDVQMDFTKSNGTFALYNFTDWDSMFISVQVVSRFNNDNDFTLSASVLPYGDANGSANINIADITYLIAYIFSFGQAPPYDVRLGDANCSGSVNIADITFLIKHIFAAGPAPCLQ